MNNYLIIGASSGIGKKLAEKLSAKGHNVYGTYRKSDKPDIPNGEFHRRDVLDEDFNLIFLPEQLHGLVYCPGSLQLKPFTRYQPRDFESDFRIQVSGAIRVIQEALPALKAAGNSSVIMFSTVAAGLGFSFHTQVATSKAAIEGLTRSLAAEYAPKIRFNAIAPSLTNTPLAHQLLNTDSKKETHAKNHPLKRIGETDDIANAASFLLSDESEWITGQIIHIDGGLSKIKTF